MCTIYICCITGPPGTGKTTTIAHVIAEYVARGMKILVTCPSNAAVDVLLERVAKMKINIRRLGHPVRTSPHLRQYTLDAMLKQNQVLDELKNEMYQARGRERGDLRKGIKLRIVNSIIEPYNVYSTRTRASFTRGKNLQGNLRKCRCRHCNLHCCWRWFHSRHT